MYEQEVTPYTFHQNYLTNDQWYEKFNTNSDVANAIGVTSQNKVLLEYIAQFNHSDAFEKITEEKQKTVRAYAEERYLAYVLLQQSCHLFLTDICIPTACS